MFSNYLESFGASTGCKYHICLSWLPVSGFGVKLRGVLVLSMAVQSLTFLVGHPPRIEPDRAPLTRARASEKMMVDLPFDFTRPPDRWKEDSGEVKPGFGGVWPGDPNAETHHVKWVDKSGETVASADVPVDRYIFYAAEAAGVDIPIINKKRMCRQGCCTTCAVKVKEGKVKPEGALGLLKDLRQEGYALTCCSYPRSDLILELQEEDEVYIRQFGENFEGGGVEWGGFLPEED